MKKIVMIVAAVVVIGVIIGVLGFVLSGGDVLEPDEDADRAEHATAFLSVGQQCEFTEHQLVFLVFDELLRV